MEWINFENILNIITLLGVLFVVYKYFRDPDVNAKTEIELLKQACRLKHAKLDDDVVMIKENHLAHIEKDVGKINSDLVKIFTILDERLPNNKN